MTKFLKSGLAGKVSGKKRAKGHFHMVYIDSVTGQPVVASEEGHTHEVESLPDGTFRLAPDPFDGHDHMMVEPYQPKPKNLSDEDEAETVQRVYSLYSAAYENESKWKKEGDEAEDFYCGQQWPEEVRQNLEKDGRACLTLNKSEKYIDDVVGYQRQARTDLKFLPVEGGDQAVCDVLNAATKVILDKCRFEQEESAVFEDEFITGRGNFNIYIDLMKDIRGDIVVERFPRDQVVYGPHEKPDASDADYLVKYQMWALSRLKSKYKDKADEIQASFADGITVKDGHVQYQTDQYLKSDNKVPVVLAGEVRTIDIAQKQMMVFELQEKLRLETTMIYEQSSQGFTNAFNWGTKELKQVETLQGLQMIKGVPFQKMRIVRVCGKVLLEDENPADLPVDDFSVIPVYGKKKGKRFWGKMQALKDPQRELNKRASQSIDIVNRMAGYGYFYDDGTFPTQTDVEDFKDNISGSGFVLKVSSVQNPPHKVEGSKMPTEVVALTEQSEARLSSLAGSSATSHAGANTSGQAIAAAEKSMLVGHERYFDNMSFGKKKIGESLIGYIQRYYPPERLARIVFNRAANPATPVEVGGQPIQQQDFTSIVQLLETADLSKVDVIVGEAEWSPSQRMSTFTTMTDMFAKGAPIPFEMILEMADMPEDVKRKMIQSIQMQQAAEAEQASTTSETEIQKSLIAKGLFPPKVLQQQGLAPPAPQPLQPPNMGGAAGLIS